MVRSHLLGSSATCLFDRLFDDARHEELQRFRCGRVPNEKRVSKPLACRYSSSSARFWDNLQINTGVACATLPTSSSACMIFLILATGNLHWADRFTIFRWRQVMCSCVDVEGDDCEDERGAIAVEKGGSSACYEVELLKCAAGLTVSLFTAEKLVLHILRGFSML